MNVPSTDEVVPEKIEDKKDEGLSFHCYLSDPEIVHNIAQELLPGLASACVDDTMGGIFKTPGSVAVDIKTEMVKYLIERSETFVAETVILETPKAEVSDHPCDIISDLVDDFASTKQNFFSHVSGWLLSDQREDKIDDFVQEMEISGFWLIDRREALAQTLLKNVDFKSEFHCDMKFNSAKELNEHVVNCGFRSMICTNEGCNARFSASHLEKHDSVCPFKIIPCEQKCPEYLMRREMDRHCITVCPMKLANCPFYAVGCQSTLPQCMVQQHHSDDLHSHLLYVLQKIHKDISTKDLRKRVEQLEKSSFDKLAEAPDVRSLTFVIKDLEAKLGPLEVSTVNEVNEERKLNEEGIVNEEVENNEERKVNEEERKVSEEGNSDEQGKSDEDGKVDAGGKITREVKVNEERNVGEEPKVNGGKVSEETQIDDGGKANGEGKINEAGKVNGANTDEAGKVEKEEKVGEEGKGTEEGKMNDQRETNEAEKVSEVNINEEEKINGGKMYGQGKANEEGRTNEAGKVNKEGKVSKERKINDEGKVSEEVKSNEAGIERSSSKSLANETAETQV